MESFRKRRLECFLRIMKPRQGMTILDLGGLPSLNGIPGFWHAHTDVFDVALLNLPGTFDRFSKAELRPYRLIEADARSYVAADKFDIVFSNALLEHVGNFRRQLALAKVIRSSGTAFWVQTPSPLFPIEAHCDVPFWWFTSIGRRRRTIAEWDRTGCWFLARQMASTRPIWPHQLRALFPDGQLITEFFIGLPKSQIVYRRDR